MDTVIVGAGQSGLALSYFLMERGIDHLLLERGRVAERWRSERWDSLRFQFPNAFVKLPGYQYDDASAFMHRDELVAWLDAYALRINAPVRCGVCVHKIARDDAGEWRVDTSAGDYAARNVVVATGPYQQPNIPAVGRRIRARVRQLPASLYTGPSQVGEGPILVVGSGASGGQIAEDLLRAGRDVTLAVGRHRRFPRRRAGRDIAYWLEELGTLDRTDPGDPTIPFAHLLSGIDGGQDLNLRDLQDRGLRLLGRLSDVTATRYQFADTLAHDLAVGDQIYAYVCALVDANINGTEALPPVVVPPAPAQIDDMIFGYVLLNDWSARDIQAWEYQPLGPFQGKAFGTTISPWVVTKAALEPFRTSTPEREVPLLPYLVEHCPMSYDIHLETTITPAGGTHETILSRTTARHLYYSAAQQLAHHAIGGCQMNTGDLLGSGTISGPSTDEYGSLLEMSCGVKHPIKLESGETRTFIEDGDELTLRGWCEGEGHRIGFGDCAGVLLPAKPFSGRSAQCAPSPLAICDASDSASRPAP